MALYFWKNKNMNNVNPRNENPIAYTFGQNISFYISLSICLHNCVYIFILITSNLIKISI